MEIRAIFLVFVSLVGDVWPFEFDGECKYYSSLTVSAFEKGTAVIGCKVDRDFGWCSLVKGTNWCEIVVNRRSEPSSCPNGRIHFTGDPKTKNCEFTVHNIESRGMYIYA
jgi:hypothetical protein